MVGGCENFVLFFVFVFFIRVQNVAQRVKHKDQPLFIFLLFSSLKVLEGEWRVGMSYRSMQVESFLLQAAFSDLT